MLPDNMTELVTVNSASLSSSIPAVGAAAADSSVLSRMTDAQYWLVKRLVHRKIGCLEKLAKTAYEKIRNDKVVLSEMPTTQFQAFCRDNRKVFRHLPSESLEEFIDKRNWRRTDYQIPVCESVGGNGLPQIKLIHTCYVWDSRAPALHLSRLPDGYIHLTPQAKEQFAKLPKRSIGSKRNSMNLSPS